MEISEIKKQIRTDYAANKLNTFQKSLLEPREPEFLFDTKSDPWEMNNLATQPASRARLMQMRRLLDSAVLASRDIMFLPEYELAEMAKKTVPYTFRLSDSLYPLKEIYRIAAMSGFRSKEVTATQIKALNNRNKIISYWAALGLRSQTRDMLLPYTKDIVARMNDDYLPVAVTASTIAFDIFGNKKAEENLKKWLSDTNPSIALMTVNYLLYVKNKVPFTNLIKQNNTAEANYMVKWAYEDFLTSLN